MKTKNEITDSIYNKLVTELYDKYNVEQADETLLVDLYYLIRRKDFFYHERKNRVIEIIKDENKYQQILEEYREIEDIVNITKKEFES